MYQAKNTSLVRTVNLLNVTTTNDKNLLTTLTGVSPNLEGRQQQLDDCGENNFTFSNYPEQYYHNQTNKQDYLLPDCNGFTNGYISENLYQQQQNYQQQQQQQQDETSHFTLDEIGAIINSREFKLDLAKPDQVSYSNNNKELIETPNAEKTKEAIYQHLKSAIDKETITMDTTNNGHHSYQQQQTRRQQQLYNNQQKQSGSNNNNNNPLTKPFVEIVEQPAKCALRFRYKCEGRSAGSLPGVNSTTEVKTYPSIRINNYSGRAVVVISCVSKEAPYLAHPHNLVGKEGCKKGICTIVINDCEPQQVRSFSGLGIQCVKRKDIEESLQLRESINVDPFRNGFQHKLNTSNIDLNVVRLCFQVFIEGSTPNKCDIPLPPLVSEPIHDKKAMSDLVISKLSHCSAPATGGREVILLCDRIARDDIQIRFFEQARDGKLVWETHMDVAPGDVHKQVAICFKSPKYFNENIQQPVMARIQLKRLSDQQVSEPRLFQFLPCESDDEMLQRKRQKIEWVQANQPYALDNLLGCAASTGQQQQAGGLYNQAPHQQAHHLHQMHPPASRQ